jgi:hypothetical protein
MEDSDIACLKRKYPFLADFSDAFIRSTGPGDLMKMESTSIKIWEKERSRDCEERLANNKMAMASTVKQIPAGEDNRWTILHQGRFLAGAACSAAKLWITAREAIGLSGLPAVACYDMAAVGLGGVITPRGWIELHNPASSKISLRMFSINNCGARINSGKSNSVLDVTMADIAELGEFKLALRAMRAAASFVRPWDFSFLALESFLLQSNFCSVDLAGLDKQASILTQFVDYILSENSNKFRDGEPFLSTGALKASWDAFFGARPQAALGGRSHNKNFKEKGSTKKPEVGPARFLNICFAWNKGLCLKSAGSCTSKRGTPLKHICNFLPDLSKPDQVCGKDHQCKDFHK